jgi:hypothetical protein
MKKAQGLSVTTIVIAALAVLVLVVLAVIFTGRAGIFTRTVSVGCEPNGGVCKQACESGEYQNPNTREGKTLTCAEGKFCCVSSAIYESLGMQGGMQI